MKEKDKSKENELSIELDADIGIDSMSASPILADGEPGDNGLSIRIERIKSTRSHVIVRALLRNEGKSPVRVKGIRWGNNAIAGVKPCLRLAPELEPHFYSTENYRSDYFGSGTMEGDRYFYPLSNQNVELGRSEDSLFPGVFVFSKKRQAGLLVAQASQEKLYPIFRFLGKVMDQPRWLFEIEETVFGTPWAEIPPGATFAGEKMFFMACETSDPQMAARKFFDIVGLPAFTKRLEKNPLPSQRIYCSWNYDFFADIDEKSMLAQIPIIKKNFPSVKFLQIDDGYQSCHAPKQRAMIDLCYGDLEKPFDPAKFPDGPKAFCDKVKAQGLRPAIWLGLWASSGSRMLKEHPDWVLRDDAGRQVSFNLWYGGTSILDPSVPGVRDYLRKMCRTVFCEWGFEGVKLDFSSFAFNMKRARFSVPGLTSVQLRHEMESIFREFLPADGFFGWCVVAGTAQPFLSQADYFRCGIDINHAEWRDVRRIAYWCANTNMLLQERPCLPNMDSIGWSVKCDENGWKTWLNLSAVNGGAIELSGDLRKLDANRLAALAKTLELSAPSRKVRCLDFKTNAMEQPPSLWLSEDGNGGIMLGIFNWSDNELSISLEPAIKLGIRGKVKDAWTGAIEYKDKLPDSICLAGRSSRLLECN